MEKTNHHAPAPEVQLRVRAIESLLTEKGLVNPETLDAIVEHYEHRVGPHCGARVVARAWTDPAYKARLLADAPAAIDEMGFGGLESTHIEVKENTPTLHNLVVCTLCSCYPWATLGLPPRWYKSAPYRARAVRDPRGLLKEFGVEFAADVDIHVWDSNAEIRYLVLPMRPAGTDGMSPEALARLVSRDAMVGTAVVTAPQR
jgi:nitrile hydratase